MHEGTDAKKSSSRTAMPASQTAYRIGLSVGEKKAGLSAVDKDKVNKVIHDMSKNSRFFKNEQRKEQQLQSRIEIFKRELATFTQTDKEALQSHIDQQLPRIEAEERDLSQIIIHVDMDAFYAAIEMRDNPDLVGKPMAVGGSDMLCTSNYEARKFGVRSAMPGTRNDNTRYQFGFIAKELCPDLIIVHPNFEKYRAASALTKTVYKIFDPNFLMMSLDEAYLNVTRYCAENELGPLEVAAQIKEKILESTQLTCSIGIGPNRMLAKICTDIKKPNGVYMMQFSREAVIDFMRSLHVRKISGVGKVTEKLLEAIGVTTCGQLFDQRATVYRLFSKQSADFFLRASMGISSTSLEKGSRKSMSHETTFKDISNASQILSKCMELCCALSKDLERKGLCGKNITVKLKLTTFEVKSRSVTAHNYISSAEDIYKYAKELVAAEFPCSLRLLGVRVSQFRDESDSPAPGQRTLESLWSSKSPSSMTSLALNAADDSMLNQNSDIEGDDENQNTNYDDSKMDSHLWDESGCNIADANQATTASITTSSSSTKRSQTDSDGRITREEASPPKDEKKKQRTLPAPVPLTSSSIVNDKRLQCPVCNQLISALSTLQFEMHVDKCLLQAEKSEAIRPPPYAAAIVRAKPSKSKASKKTNR